MRPFTIVLAFLFVSHTARSQVIAGFENDSVRLEESTSKTVYHNFKIKVSDPNYYKNYRLEVLVDYQKTTASQGGIMFRFKNSFTITPERSEIDFGIQVDRDSRDDKDVILVLKGFDVNGKPIPDSRLSKSTYVIRIKPVIKSDSLGKDDVFWIYTGTNVDLLDGPKLKELYFKGTYLTQIVNSKHWAYVTFGKNRYLSSKDSITGQPFTDVNIEKSNKDSTYIKSGFYKTAYEEYTDNVYASLSYARPILGNVSSKLFWTLGGYLSLQTITRNSKNTIVSSFEKSYSLAERPILNPPVQSTTFHTVNYTANVGLLYKITTDKADIRTEITAGYNRYLTPYTIKHTASGIYESLRARHVTYIQFRFEGTVLNPGISIGADIFFRSGSLPLMNFSITKVIDIKQLKSLFSKVGG